MRIIGAELQRLGIYPITEQIDPRATIHLGETITSRQKRQLIDALTYDN